MKIRILLGALLLWSVMWYCIHGDDTLSLTAFPGAEGAGAMTTGGRGGRVIKVTNLNAKGPGSLKWACDQEGPRIVVFEVSGVIKPPGRSFASLNIRKPDITIAGQTAPGAGITIAGQIEVKGRGLDTKASKANTILRFLRVRPSLGSGGRDSNLRAVMIVNCKQVIVDHVSGSWQADDGFSAWHAVDTTFQWCAAEESDINLEGGHEPHNFGMLVKAYGTFSSYHNLIAHHNGRAPSLEGNQLDFRNTVMYNNGRTSVCYAKEANILGNYQRYGPGSIIGVRFYMLPLTVGMSRFTSGRKGRYGLAGNYDEINGGYNASKGRAYKGKTLQEKPLTTCPSKYYIAEEGYDLVMAHAGCLPRDAVSKRTIADVQTRTGEWGTHIPDKGLMEGLTPGKAPLDSDNDGMPDSWEKAHSLNPKDPKDNNKTVPAGASPGDRHRGYTYIEYYTNELADIKVAEALTLARLDQTPPKPWNKPAKGLTPCGSPHKSIDEMVAAIAEQTVESAKDPKRKRGLSSRGWYAVQQLSRMGEAARPAVPKLIPLLTDSDSRRVSCAAWALGAIGPAAKEAVPALLKALGKKQNTVNGKFTFPPYGFIAWALGRIGADSPQCADLLAKLLSEKLPGGRDSWAKSPAAWTLSKMSPANTKPVMGSLFRALSERFDVSFHASRALANIGAPAVPKLTSALSGRGAVQAARALADIGPAAKPAVKKLLEIAESGDPKVKRAALRALVKIDTADSGVIDGISKALSDPEIIVRHGAALALKEAGTSAKAAVPALEKALADERKEIRRAAALALGAIGKSAVPVLAKALSSSDTLVRKYAARAIGNASKDTPGNGVDALIKVLSDKDGEVRREAAWSLALIGPGAKKAEGALTTAKDRDTDYVVRYAAGEALERIR